MPGIKIMAECLSHGLKRIPQHFLLTRWFIGHCTHQGKNIHSSSVNHSFDTSSLRKLIQQGKRNILKLKSKDSVPKDYALIYKAPLELTFRIAYPTAMLCGMGMIGSLLYKEYNKENIILPMSGGRERTVKFFYPKQEVWFFSSMLVLMIIAASAIMLKYPFRIYKHNNRKEYLGIFLSPVLPYLRQVQFKSATPTNFKNPFYFFVRDCHYIIDGKRKALLIDQFFRIPKDLTDMYEEPKKES